MIVRIMTEGQYRMPSSALDELNDIDNRIVEAAAKEDGSTFHQLLLEMRDYVVKNGQPVPVEELVESDVVLPNSDTSLEEARHLFVGEGLIPG